MDGDDNAQLLDALSAAIDGHFEELGEDRKIFFRGLRSLRDGKVEEASRVFRRAARRCERPFSTMARMAQGRCEVVRGHQGSAMRIFESVADSEAPMQLRRLAWMEMADLARRRGDEGLLEEARAAIEELVRPPTPQ